MSAMQDIPPIEIEIPDLTRWAQGNQGVPYVWRTSAADAGPHVVVQALTHGNEVCGALALDWLLKQNFRPAHGTFTAIFANMSAYRHFDPASPFDSRFIDQDFNRIWNEDILDGEGRNAELDRARELRPFYDQADYLLDIHSFNDPCLPLLLAGRRRKGVELSRALGIAGHIMIDAGHDAGKRLRDYAHFDAPSDPRTAILIECGQHWALETANFAREAMLRFLRHFEMLPPDFPARLPTDRPGFVQREIEVTDAITIRSDHFAFVKPVKGLDVIPERGTLLARDGATEVRTPYDECVVLMPTRAPKKGATAVRFGRFLPASG